jgi:DNA-binding response OmpR family regulator
MLDTVTTKAALSESVAQLAPVEASADMIDSPTLPRLLKVGDLVVDMLRRTVQKNGKKLRMTSQMLDILVYLAIRSKMDGSVNKTDLDEWLHGRVQKKSHSAQMSIYRLRGELGVLQSLLTISYENGIGYRLVMP